MAFYNPVFLVFFLPTMLLAYFLLGKRLRNLVLLLFSLAFYFWGAKAFALILLLCIIVNYGISLYMQNCQIHGNEGKQRIALSIAIVFNLALLIIYKYSNFIIANINIALGYIGLPAVETIDISAPLGISFITFSAISYVVDVFRKDGQASKNPLDLAFYLSFFPKIGAGPLDRYDSITSQAAKRSVTGEQFASGVRRFIIGLGKKILIANTIGFLTDKIFSIPAEHMVAGTAWLGILCFTIQLYFDFSGYTDMAIGIGRMFGFELMENFNYPYISSSIREFWRRWHISMSRWFRDYLYIPLGGNRVKPARTYLNLMVVFLLCGLWHGASWTFIVWGLWHGAFLIFERVLPGKGIKSLWSPVRHIYALLVVMIGWVFFRSPTIAYAFSYIRAMFTSFGPPYPGYDVAMYMNYGIILALIAGIIGATPIIPSLNSLKQKLENIWSNPSQRYVYNSCYAFAVLVILLAIFVLSVSSIAGESFKPFIYSQF